MADTVGNLLGERGTFVYTTDTGETVNFSQDRSVGLAVGNTLATTSTRPVSVNNKYLQGRYVLAQLEDNPRVKKRIVIGSPTAASFDTETSTTLIINGQNFVTTGRVGEKASFLRLTPLITEP